MKTPEYDVVLLPSFIQVEAWRRAHAPQGESGLFAQTVTTFNAWVADLWERFGDGRRLVDSVERAMLMRIAFSQRAALSEASQGEGDGDSPAAGETAAGSAGAGGAAGDAAAGFAGAGGAAGDAAAGFAGAAEIAGEGSPADAPAEADDDACVLTLSPGLSALAARCEMMGAGIAEYDKAVANVAVGKRVEALSTREELFLKAIADYRVLLRRFNLIEPGEAARLVADQNKEAFPRPLRVLCENAAPFDWRTERFFAACPQLSVTVHYLPGADGVVPVPDGVTLEEALPAGRYASAGVIMDVLARLCSGERAVVTSVDPLGLYRELEPAFARAGLVGSVQGQMRFGETDFGRAYLLAMRVEFDKTCDSTVLADLLRTPFAGVSRRFALDYDARLRADRIADRRSCVDELCRLSDDFAALLSLTRRDATEAGFERFSQMIWRTPSRSAAWRAQQQAAIGGLQALKGYAETLNADWRDVYTVLDQIVVTVNFAGKLARTAEAQAAQADEAATDAASSANALGAAESPSARRAQDEPDILITTQGAAAQLPPAAFALLIAADLSAESYPIADKDDAATTLFSKLGLQAADDELSRARRTFSALLRVPTRAFVCMRPQNDADGNPSYPCAMLEELTDMTRERNASAASAGAVARDGGPGAASSDAASGGVTPDEPAPVFAARFQRGEDALYANACAGGVESVQEMAAHVPVPIAGELPKELVPAVLPPRVFPDSGIVLERSLSPSQIESWLECPYRWFAQRRLNVSSLEEDFGPMERGNFCHRVLERFYRSFQDRGHAKVNAGNIEAARELMRATVRALLHDMHGEEPGSGRWVASNRLEEREMAQVGEELVEFLDYECQILPDFHPAYFEYRFDENNAVEYGGCSMVGTVDRIDVDDKGHAVIIDYKGSVNAAQEIAGKNAADPGKVQTRIYAQMVQRTLGLQLVGALYVSYGKAHRLAGAADDRVLESSHLPGAHGDTVWCRGVSSLQDGYESFDELSFQDMLDATEQLVAEAVTRMAAGAIAPCPANRDVCAWCSVESCPERR